MLQRLFFRKSARLLTSSDYSEVFKGATRKFTSSAFVGLALAHSREQGRIGVIVSKKNIRKAVFRNRIKRMTRESFRMNQHLLTGLDIVIIARASMGQLDDKGLSKLLDKAWTKLKN